MDRIRKPVFISGVLLGALFLGNALINYSRAWPLLWPLLGGALAVYLASRHMPLGFGGALKVGARAGFIGGLFVLIIGTPVHWVIAKDALQQRAMEANLPLDGVLLVAALTAFLGLLNVVFATIGSAVAAPIFARR
ncbi:MAG TPA: hypothetical protein VEY11_17505 [Pyrinomonadaceae bacterium]|nr:hypothetical protein [Pyrinomonadaceae bacterium]